MRERLRRGGAITRLLWVLPFRAGRWRPIAGIGLFGVRQLAAVVGAVALKVITDGVLGHDHARARLGLVLFILAAVGSLAGSWASYSLRLAMIDLVEVAIDADIAEMTSRIPTIEHFERSEYLDRIDLLRQNHQQLASFPDIAAQAGFLALRAAVTVAVLARVHPAFVTLPLFTIPSLIAGWLSQRRFFAAWDGVGNAWRLHGALFRLAGDEAAGREARVFGVRNYLSSRFEELVEIVNRALSRANAVSAATQAVGWMIFGSSFAACVVLTARRVVAGAATPGDLVLALTLGAQLNSQVSSLASIIGNLPQSTQLASRFLWLSEYSATNSPPSATVSAHPPDRLTVGIELRGVTFAYPGTDVPVLQDVDLVLPAGTTAAVVGENGAGKTTLVKLLTGLYQPTSGTITIDGLDLADMSPEAWRGRISAGFQDFARFEFTAQHTVGVGLLSNLDSEAAALAALERAHGTDVLNALPHGAATQLGRRFDTGVELSGGQWQKLALGRAMMREDPLLLVLDEPTAALDAGTEAALFERYAGAAQRSARRAGAITLLVSHRFSTVRMADLIIVIDQGRVVEVGSHTELIAAAGLYSELFEAQASSYR